MTDFCPRAALAPELCEFGDRCFGPRTLTAHWSTPFRQAEYDLRAVLRFLAYGKPGAVYNPVEGYIQSAFSAAFSRAAHGLEERGILIRSGLSWWPLRIVILAPDAPMFDHPWITTAGAVLEVRDKADRARSAQVVAALKALYPHSGV